MPAAPSADILSRIADGAVRVTRRAEILNSDGTMYASAPDLVEGSISVDATRDERRTFDCTFKTDSSTMRVGAGYVWYDKRVKFYRGIEWSGGSWEVPLGTFVIDSLEAPHFPPIIKLAGRDLTKVLSNSKFASTTGWTAGTSISSIVSAIAVNGGITDYSFSWAGGTSPTLASDIVFEAGSSRWEAISKLVKDNNHDVYFDAYGSFIIQPFRDPATGAPTFTFQTGSSGNLVTYTKKSDDARLYNHIVVIAERSDTIPLYGEASITDTTLSTHKNKIGDRVFVYNSNVIDTQAAANDLANAYLKIYGLEEYQVSLESIVFPWLEAGDVIEFIDPSPTDPNLPTRYFLASFTVPLTIGSMSLDARRVQIVK